MFFNFQVLFVDLFSFIYECLNQSSFLPPKQVILVASRPATILNSSWLGKELTKPTRMTCSIVGSSSTRELIVLIAPTKEAVLNLSFAFIFTVVFILRIFTVVFILRIFAVVLMIRIFTEVFMMRIFTVVFMLRIFD